MTLKDWLYHKFFDPPQSEIEQTSPPPSIDVEEIAFPIAISPDDPFPNLVIDFGTTATVVGVVLPEHPTWHRVKLDLLPDDNELESAMSLDPNGNVSAVRENVYSDSTKKGHTYITSMKRYLELASRSRDQSSSFYQIVRDFLTKAIGRQYRSRAPIGPTSEIVISVPNSFNPGAVDDIRTGVVYAINDLNNNHAELTISHHNVKIVRESEAVAYLYSRGSRLAPAPTMEIALSEAPFSWEIIHSADREVNGPDRIIVLDAGGGTTDLSVVEVGNENTGDRAVRVVLNAGIPLGGADVDNLLFRGLLADKFDLASLNPPWLIGDRNDLLNEIRKIKHSNPDQFFTNPDPAEPDEFRKALSLLLKLVPELIRRYSLGEQQCSEADTRAYRVEAVKRLRKLTRLSVTGLFDLIPQSAKNGVSRILLTGRASRLRGIREAVIEQAQKLDADVECLRYAYHAKLAVAYGCALIKNREFSGSRLPSGTLGRTLEVFDVSDQDKVFAAFHADFPVSGDAPTLFHARLPGNPNYRASYSAWEYKTDVTPAFFDEVGWPANFDPLEWLGCARPIAKWDLTTGYSPQGAETRFLLWHPAEEAYYSVDRTQMKWSERRSPKPFSWSDLNYVTDLPLGFPYEGLERNLGGETEVQSET